MSKSKLAAVAVVAIAAGTTAYAAIPDGAGTIHGCYDKSSGALRVTDSTTNTPKGCSTNEIALDWNQQGAKGDQGDPGPSIARQGEGTATITTTSNFGTEVAVLGGTASVWCDAPHPADAYDVQLTGIQVGTLIY
jgi:hypothetical protein